MHFCTSQDMPFHYPPPPAKWAFLQTYSTPTDEGWVHATNWYCRHESIPQPNKNGPMPYRAILVPVIVEDMWKSTKRLTSRSENSHETSVQKQDMFCRNFCSMKVTKKFTWNKPKSWQAEAGFNSRGSMGADMMGLVEYADAFEVILSRSGCGSFFWGGGGPCQVSPIRLFHCPVFFFVCLFVFFVFFFLKGLATPKSRPRSRLFLHFPKCAAITHASVNLGSWCGHNNRIK